MARRKKNELIPAGNFDDFIKGMQLAAPQIQAAVVNQIKKGWKQIPNADANRSPKSWFQDPLSLQYSLGYKDRKYSLTYDTLRRMAARLGVIQAILNLRCSQVAAFSEPFRKTRNLGFVIKHKDPDHATTSAEIEFIKELENFVINCGRAEPNPYSLQERDDFEGLLRKIVRDSLTLDQLCIEVVPDGHGIPYEFMAVDAATIRYAADDRLVGVNSSYHQREGFVPGVPSRFAALYDNRVYGGIQGKPISYVQVISGQIENVYTKEELIFGVRNPQTNIYLSAYGMSELEMLITIITSHLNAEEYNRNFFQLGSSSKGLINLKGDNYTPEMLEAFKRQWLATMTGVENSHKIGILQSEGLEWVDMNKTNRDMEFGQWMEYLIKVTAAVYLCDPEELGFSLKGGVSQTPLFESAQEWKIKASRDRGLKPLLKFIAKLINKNIIDRIDDHFTFEFVGLDELSEQEKHEMVMEQISSYKTLNEVRRQQDLPELPGGDMPMNPVYLQAIELQNQMKMQEQQAQMMQQQQMQSPPVTPEKPQGLPGANPDMEDPGPLYTDNFKPNTGNENA